MNTLLLLLHIVVLIAYSCRCSVCARIAGRFLPQLRGLVFAQCPLGRIGELLLPVECSSKVTKLYDLGADHTVC